MRISIDKQKEIATTLIKELATEIGESLVNDILNANQENEIEIDKQRTRVAELKSKIATMKTESAKRLLYVADYLVKKSV